MGWTCQRIWSQLGCWTLKKLVNFLASRQPKTPEQQNLWIDIIKFCLTRDSRPTHMIAAITGNNVSLQVWTKVYDCATWLFIYSGSFANYISPQFAIKYQISLQKKKQLYGLNTFEGKSITYNNRRVIYHTCLVRLWLNCHWEKIKFDITETFKNHIILGIVWLRQ